MQLFTQRWGWESAWSRPHQRESSRPLQVYKSPWKVVTGFGSCDRAKPARVHIELMEDPKIQERGENRIEK